MTGSKTDSTALSSTTNAPEPVSSLSGDIELILQLLGHDVPDDIADQDIATLLRQLDQAETIGQNVEERIDAVLSRLDTLLSTLQPEGEPQIVDVQACSTRPQPEGSDKDQGR
jgi:hypothetical protein